MERKTYYLVGNAHLDPMWQWRWQEGSMEAKATIRSALDRMNEYPFFKFVCSSSSVYQWVEEFAPEMFEEVKERVKQGRFIIVGGWYVQPDCNLPSGESFARQGLYAQRYFNDKFGHTATIGYCVDSFGHCATLPMILRNCGLDSYIYMRPSHKEKDIESDIFNWIAPDGSSVLAYHIIEPYAYNFKSMEQVVERFAELDNDTRTKLDTLPVFYGVGNHGGGPTILNIELFEEFRKKHPEKEFIYSDLHDFFDRVRCSDTKIPNYTGELQHHASGCYSTESPVKNAVRRSENDLSAAENYSMLASALCGRKFDNKIFHDAWEQVCFCHFHDSMGGCSIKEAHEDTIEMLGYAKHIAAVQENNALQSISWKINTKDNTLGQPIVVFNPHGFEVTDLVQVNADFNTVCDANGNNIACQSVLSSTQECTNRCDTLFEATVPALGYRVYYMSKNDETETVDSCVNATACQQPLCANGTDGTILENDFYTIKFEEYSGYIISFVDKQTGEELISGKAAVPTVIDEYYHDTWSHAKNFFTNEMARFSDAKVTVIENGPVRATVKVVSRYNKSVLTEYFSLSKGSKKLDVKAFVDWHEKYKMLKIYWPMNVNEPKAYYEIPYGIIERPCDGEEEPGINWTAIKGTDRGFALLNNNTYSSSVKDNVICHTILRSPIYGDHGGERTSESEFTSQGRTDFNYSLMPVDSDWNIVVKNGKILNKGLTSILDTWHDGSMNEKSFSGLNVDKANVIVSAVKRSEDGKGTVVRMFETDGVKTDFVADGSVLPCVLSATIEPYAVKTWICYDETNKWSECLFTEYAK